MKKILTVIFLTCIAALSVRANVLVITDVPVEATGDNTVAARELALKQGQEEAFRRLIQKMVVAEKQSDVAPVSSEQLMDMVKDVSVSNEKTTATKYMGTVSVRFKTSAVKSFLKEQDIPFKSDLPAPLLIVPVYQNEIGLIGLEGGNPFFASLKQSVPVGQIYQFRVPAGDETDVAAVAAMIATKDSTALQPILQKYGVSRALVVSVVQNGTSYQVETHVSPSTRMPEAEVKFAVTDDRTRPIVVAHDLLNDMVRYMEKQWTRKEQSRDVKKEKLEAAIPLNSMAEMGRLQKELKKIRGVENATVKGIQNKQLLVELTFMGDKETLHERITGPFVLTERDGSYVLMEKGAENAEVE